MKKHTCYAYISRDNCMQLVYLQEDNGLENSLFVYISKRCISSNFYMSGIFEYSPTPAQICQALLGLDIKKDI